MPKDISIETAHRMCDHLERDIKSKLQHASVMIHVEPGSEKYEQCPIPPDLRHNKH
jgi:divalent metal cation (Fe/Co/Zn/Cd) transporter